MINIQSLSLKVEKVKNARYPLNKKVTGPEDIEAAFRAVLNLEDEAEEIFAIMTLDTKLKITGIFEVSRGILNASLVHPREIFKRAILMNAYSIALSHNHPSGDPKPSKEDLLLTERLTETGKIIGINITDHIIIGDECRFSFSENGLL